MSLTRRFTELPNNVRVPPSKVAKERGNKTFEGDIFLRSHQLSIKGNNDATTGVLGTIPDIGAIKKAIKEINFLGVLILSEEINSLTLSKAPLLNNAEETANKPIRVIKDGLPNPAKAFSGERTPVAINIPTHNKPVNSGAIVFLINKIIDIIKTTTVINASKLLLTTAIKFIQNLFNSIYPKTIFQKSLIGIIFLKKLFKNRFFLEYP